MPKTPEMNTHGRAYVIVWADGRRGEYGSFAQCARDAAYSDVEEIEVWVSHHMRAVRNVKQQTQVFVKAEMDYALGWVLDSMAGIKRVAK